MSVLDIIIYTVAILYIVIAIPISIYLIHSQYKSRCKHIK